MGYACGRAKIESGRNAPTTQLGASTSSWMRRSTATDAIAYAVWRSMPWVRWMCSIVALVACLAASVRSGSMPVQT